MTNLGDQVNMCMNRRTTIGAVLQSPGWYRSMPPTLHGRLKTVSGPDGEFAITIARSVPQQQLGRSWTLRT